jgi:hypothetical protein
MKKKDQFPKLKKLIERNGPGIKRIVASEAFTLMLEKHQFEIDLREKEIKEHDGEIAYTTWCLFNVPIVTSPSVVEGCIFEMKDGQYYILKNI